MLKDVLNGVLNRIGAVLRIDEQILDSWVAERVDHVIDEDPNSVYTVTALVLTALNQNNKFCRAPMKKKRSQN